MRFDDPKISCLMVTKGALRPACFAIECYRRQTHRNRELVIVCDREARALADWIGELGDPTIRFIHAEPASLGNLRNASVAAAEGELVCQWDDDDLYHPRRLEVQLGSLNFSETDANFVNQWTLWWPVRELLAVTAERIWEGSMLVRRSILPEYPDQPRGEDKALVRTLRLTTPVSVSRFPAIYCYVVHGANTWPESHFEKMAEHATQQLTGLDYLRGLAEMRSNFPIDAYRAHLSGIGDNASPIAGETLLNPSE